MNKGLHVFRFSAAAIGSSLCLIGCASYRDLPAGTHTSIAGKPEAAIEREVVDLSPMTVPSKLSPAYNEYIVGPNDVLYVNVNGRIEFSGNSTGNASSFKGYRVDGRGCVYLPLAGRVPVAGLPLSEVRDRISSAMRYYFNDPWIVVEIAEYRTRQVFVFGAVKKPGPIAMPASGVNLAQAIASAELRDGGYNFRKIRIIRSNSPTEGELLVVDFDSVLRGKALPMQLQEGDIIYVPKSAFGGWNEVIADLLPSLQTVSSLLQPFVTIKYLENN